MTTMTRPVTTTPYTTIRACWCIPCARNLPRMSTTHHPDYDHARRHGVDLAKEGHRVEMYRGHLMAGTTDRLVATITPTSEWYDLPRTYRGATKLAQLVREDLRAIRRDGALDIPADVRLSVRKDSTALRGGIRVEMTNPDRWATTDRNTPSARARTAAGIIRETFEAYADGYTWCEIIADSMVLASIAPRRH